MALILLTAACSTNQQSYDEQIDCLGLTAQEASQVRREVFLQRAVAAGRLLGKGQAEVAADGRAKSDEIRQHARWLDGHAGEEWMEAFSKTCDDRLQAPAP